MTDLVIPPDATPDTTFRCAKWACTLAFKHCLRRQSQRFQKAGETAGKAWKLDRPHHPYCAEQCEDGRAIRARFGAGETSVVSVNGFGTLAHRRTKPPAPPAQETTMPTGIRSTPCPGCGTTGSKHRAVNGKDCPERGKSARAKKATKAKPVRAANVSALVPGQAAKVAAALRARAGKAPTAAYVVPVEQLDIEDLARSIAQCRAELARRLDAADALKKRIVELVGAVSEAA